MKEEEEKKPKQENVKEQNVKSSKRFFMFIEHENL